MRTAQRIAKNSGVSFLAQVISYILSFFFFMYTARYLGADDFGILSFALALAAILGAFSDLGLRQITTREVARDKSLAKKYLSNVVGMKIILVVIVSAGLVILVSILNYPQKTKYAVYLIGLSIVFTAFLQMFYGLFQAHEKMEFEAIGNILRNSLLLLIAILIIAVKSSVLMFALSYSLIELLILGYAVGIYLWKFGGMKLEADIDFWKATLKHALPFGLTAVFGMINNWISTVMLSAMKGDVVVGWYNAAYRIVSISLFIPGIFMAAIYPVMSIFFRSSPSSLRPSLEKSFKYLTILGIPIGIGTMLLAKRLILVIFGAEYTNSTIALQILAWSSVFIFMYNAFANLLNSINKQIIITKVMGICLGVNVVLNLILIPKYSLIGASIITALTQLIALLFIFIWSSRIGYSVFRKVFANIIAKVVISSASMGIFIIYFHNLTLLALIPSAAFLYFIMLYIIGGIDKEDINLVTMVVRKK